MENSSLFQIKRDIETCVGQKVQLKANKGRKKAFIKEGILENTYPSIFVVRFENDYEATRRVSSVILMYLLKQLKSWYVKTIERYVQLRYSYFSCKRCIEGHKSFQ